MFKEEVVNRLARDKRSYMVHDGVWKMRAWYVKSIAVDLEKINPRYSYIYIKFAHSIASLSRKPERE